MIFFLFSKIKLLLSILSYLISYNWFNRFVDNPSISLSVRSGSNRHDFGGIIHNVTTFSYHEKYNEQNNDYDIAVFKVYPPFDFNNTTQPVKLPENIEFFNTNWGLIAGWGYFIVSSFI